MYIYTIKQTKTNKMKLTTERLKEQDLEFTNSRGDLIEVSMRSNWINLWVNGSISKSTKSIKPIQDKIDFLTLKP
mgnify:CR=1 FL=1